MKPVAITGLGVISALPRGNALIERSNDLCKLGYWAAHAAIKDSGIRLGDGYECALISGSAVGLAAQLVARGRYQAALTGGVDIYSRSLHACYSTVRKVSPLDVEGVSPYGIGSRPWRANRNGFVYSEGAS